MSGGETSHLVFDFSFSILFEQLAGKEIFNRLAKKGYYGRKLIEDISLSSRHFLLPDYV